MTEGLGEIAILHPPGTFALTPASLISLRGIGKNRELLAGLGLDWGSGTGCLAIAAAKVPSVDGVVGLEISEKDVEAARRNALENGVAEKTTFMVSDSYQPLHRQDRERLEDLVGQVGFVIANPPASEGDDGFEYRRAVLRGARRFMHGGGVVFLSISYQYGPARIERLVHECPGFAYGGALASTGWVPFDLGRPDLLRCLEQYAEERRGGPEYTFGGPEGGTREHSNARDALAEFGRTRRNPLSKWQTHLLTFGGA